MNKELAEAAGKALTDFLIENYVSSDPLPHNVESQSAIIKKQRDEIESLKKETTEIGELKDIIKYKDGESDDLCRKANEYIDEIAKLKYEINQLEHEIAETNLKTFVVSSGDFSLKHVVSKGHFLVFKDGDDSRRVSEADVNKKLRELYFRTEEKRSCETCNHDKNGMCTLIGSWRKCLKNDQLLHWLPKTT